LSLNHVRRSSFAGSTFGSRCHLIKGVFSGSPHSSSSETYQGNDCSEFGCTGQDSIHKLAAPIEKDQNCIDTSQLGHRHRGSYKSDWCAWYRRSVERQEKCAQICDQAMPKHAQLCPNISHNVRLSC